MNDASTDALSGARGIAERWCSLSEYRKSGKLAMFDLLVRISGQWVQIKKLVLELMIQSPGLDSVAPFETQPMPAETTSVRGEADIVPDAPHSPRTASRLSASVSQMLFLCWLVCLIALNGILLNEPLSRWLVHTIAPSKSNTIGATLRPLLTAAYKN